MTTFNVLACISLGMLLVMEALALGKLPLFQQEVTYYGDYSYGAMAINPSGTRAVLGGYPQRFVLVFDRVGQTWHPTANLTFPTAGTYNSFFVGISKDGNTIVSGDGSADSNAGSVYVYQYSAGAWDSGVKLTSPGSSYLGYGVAISQDGNTIGAGTETSTAGLVIFQRTGTNSWQQQGPPLQINVTDTNYCGQGTSFSSDGNLVVFGTPHDESAIGAFFFFKRNSSMGWNQSGPKIILTGTYGFGARVAMSGDGELVVMGSYDAAWLYELSSNKATYTLLQTFNPPGATYYFGRAVAITSSAQRIVIGDTHANYVSLTRDSTYTYYTGAVFIYDRLGSGATPFTLTGNITIPVIESSSSDSYRSGFGYALAISDENHLVVNAYGSNDRESEALFFVGQGSCRPSYSLTQGECASRNNNCGSSLKWTGKGCRSKKGKILGDGGCQCKGYCGYTCRGACNGDKECVWASKKKACYVRANGLPGGPITNC